MLSQPLARRCNKARVFLAIVKTSDPTGLYSTAGNAEIGRVADVAALWPAAVRELIRSLEADGLVVGRRMHDCYIRRRVLVLRDHHHAISAIHALDALSGRPGGICPVDVAKLPAAVRAMVLDVTTRDVKAIGLVG